MINLSKCKTEQEVQAAMDYEHLKTKYIILEHDIYNISMWLAKFDAELQSKMEQQKELTQRINEYANNFPVKDWEADIE